MIFAVEFDKLESTLELPSVGQTGRNPMVLTKKSLASERRRYPRFSVDLPMKYTRTKLYSRYGKYGRVVNASEGGLLAHLPEETEVGQQTGATTVFFFSF